MRAMCIGLRFHRYTSCKSQTLLQRINDCFNYVPSYFKLLIDCYHVVANVVNKPVSIMFLRNM